MRAAKSIWYVSFLCLLMAGQVWSTEPDKRLMVEAERIIKYKLDMEAAPKGVPSRNVVDAPLLGNGVLGAVITAQPDSWPLKFWVMKSNFCKLRHDHRKGGPRPFGGLDIDIPAMKGSSWRSEQDIFPAITTCRFNRGGTNVVARTFIAATDDILIIELTSEGAAVDVNTRLWPVAGRGSKEQIGRRDGIQWATKAFVSGPEGGTHPAEIPTLAGCALTVMGAKDAAFGVLPGQTATGMVFKLQPGKTVTIALAMQSNFDTKEPLEAALAKVAGLTPEKLKALEEAHRQWWRSYWADSLIEIDEPQIQQAYYAANYAQGSGMRDKDFPSGLFGLWITGDDPNWAGDYHLNFDYQSQFYSLCKNNHIEQMATFDQPILEFIPRGKFYAEKVRGIRGVYYPVGIFAKGMETSRQPGIKDGGGAVESGGVFLGQKSNAAYCLVPMAMRWYHTYDTDYAKKVYPFVIEVANFWEDYLQYEPVDTNGVSLVAPVSTNPAAPKILTINGVPFDKIPVSRIPKGRYVISSDSIQENIHTGGSGDMNGVLSLGLVRNAFELILDMSKELGVDADRRERWEHILKNMSQFPTFEKDGKTVFRFTEKGTEWVVDNSVGTQHIFPSGGVGLDDTRLAEIGRNTITAKSRWNCDNGVNSFYPSAVRVGYDPKVLLEKLDNLFFANSARTDSHLPRGLEDSSIVPGTINEMLCMSHRQVLRVFPVWPKEKNARFWNLRAEGAFLVSSALKGGKIPFVKIISEKGRDCTMVNPWAGKSVDVYCAGKKVETLRGDRFVMKTTPGSIYMLSPEGSGAQKE
ncbi:MAG: hypothetical protein WCN95_14975 [bacterium]